MASTQKSTPGCIFLALTFVILNTLPYRANGATIYICTGQDGIRQYADHPRKLTGCGGGITKILSQEDPSPRTEFSHRQDQAASTPADINVAALDQASGYGASAPGSKWSSVTATFTILHLGDSHVRASAMESAARDALRQAKPGGKLVYRSFGINGSTYASSDKMLHFFENRNFPQQADLLILDWGTNEIAKGNEVPENHSRIVMKLIQRARKAYPQATIMLTSTQDMNYRGRNVAAAAEYAVLMRQIAYQNGCLFFDWYHISGGPGSMRIWAQSGLAQADNIHLTPDGYSRKGVMLAKSIEDALTQRN